MSEARDYPAIEDLAVIGDCGCAALVSRQGNVEWMCWPRFDSPSLFASLLDRERGGSWSIRPTGEFGVERRYLERTNVLETTFRTEDGELILTDLVAVRDLEQQGAEMWPEHELLREVRCTAGEVEIEMHFEPRPDYGRECVHFSERGSLGFFCQHGKQILVVRSDLPVETTDDGRVLRCRLRLQEGERRHVSFSCDSEEAAILLLLGDQAERRIRMSVDYWRHWCGRTRYRGPHVEEVRRSLLALKLLTFSRSGAVVAAATTSLPERIGGERNWDYRFCWVRDTAMTVRALYELDAELEAEAFVQWLLNAVGGTQSSLQILYDVYGNTRLPERTLDELDGYRHSRPVRIGNDARDQFQLDIYGEVVSAVFELARRDLRPAPDQIALLRRLGRTVCERWQEKDNGIWEKRSEKRHHTHSKVMCWVALDRLLQLHDQFDIEVPAERFREDCEEMRQQIEERGWNDELGSYVSVFDSDEVDASLLLLPIFGYVEADSPRTESTLRHIEERLGEGDLLYRYRPETDDGIAGHEGAFGICSFWRVQVLALMGRLDEAEDAFDSLLRSANDLGLYGEEIDPDTGAALGNFPQAFSHVGLINAALTLARVRGESERGEMHERLEDETRGGGSKSQAEGA